MTEERLEKLMVSVVDGVATPDEQRELSEHLKMRPELAAELESHMSIKSMTDEWVGRLELDLAEDRHRTSARLEARLGVSLLLAGLAVLTGFGLVEAMMAPDAPMWVRVGTGLSLGGSLLLLVAVIRWRLATLKSDAYKEIVR